ncbi:probable protein strawberry notch homolog 1 [Coccomyxa sp. Obi]|nr:probable protein strawberry notch homolog 1 [Coccomyxa sp. Obi]
MATAAPSGHHAMMLAAQAAQQQALRRQQEEARKKKEQERNERREIAHDEVVNAAAGFDHDDEGAEVYATYRPAKLKEGCPHPDIIVESALLACVSPPDITYKHHLQDIVEEGLISDAQLEAVVYANMRFQNTLSGPKQERAGFFLGDGAGVGKGRTIAATMKEHFVAGQGSRALWVSVSKDLCFDAQRDLDDVKCDVTVFPQGNTPLPKGNLEKHYSEGVLFVTYSLLVSNTKSMAEPKLPGAENAADVQNDFRIPKGSRLEQIINWLKGGDGDSLIVFDECHKAKNLIAVKGEPTQTGRAVLALQKVLPRAKVLYSSATGASEPHNLAYMVRLGNFGFGGMMDMIRSLAASGLGALELFSMGLKATGTYISRSLSYAGAEFSIVRVDVDPVFKVMYDRACKFWHFLFNIFQEYHLMNGRQWMQFYAAEQRFFRQMLMAAKVHKTAQVAREAIRDGMSVVIGLQSTGEANTNATREESGDVLDDFVSAPKVIMQQFLEKQFPREARECSGAELRKLLYQVHEVVKQVKEYPPAAEEAVQNMKLAAHRAKLAEKAAARQSPQQKRSRAGSSAGASRNAAADDDDNGEDDIEVAAELDLDAVLERRRAAAIANGDMVDLAADVNEAAIAAAAAAMAADAEAAKREAAERAKEARLERFRIRKAEAEEELAEAKEALEKCRQKMVAAATDRPANSQQPGAAGKKLLRKRSAAENASRDASEQAEDTDDFLAQLQRDRSTKRRKSQVLLDDEDEDEETLDTEEPATDAEGVNADDEELQDEEEEEEQSFQTAKSDSKSAEEQLAELDETACQECGRTDRGEKMLLCDGCDHGYHMDCLDPPVVDVPEGDWFCPACTEAKKPAAATTAAAARAGPSSQLRRPTSVAQQAEKSCTDSDIVQPVQKRGRRTIVVLDSSDDEDCIADASVTVNAPAIHVKAEPGSAKKAAKPSGTAAAKVGRAASSLRRNAPRGGRPATVALVEDESDEEQGGSKAGSNNGSRSRSRSRPGRPPATRVSRLGRAAAALMDEDDSDFEEGPVLRSRRGGNGCLAGGGLRLGELAAQRRLHRAEQELAEAENALARAEAEPIQRKRSGVPSPHGAAGRTRAGRAGQSAPMVLDESDSASEDSDFSADEDSDDEDDDSSDSDAELCAEYRPHVQNRELGDTWEDEAKESKVAKGEGHEELKLILATLLRLWDAFELPANPLDQLTELLGGTDKVAEMTGRKGLLVRAGDGKVEYQARRAEEAQKNVNMAEKNSFMQGEKFIAIISEAASTGISLQADKRVANQRRRCHLTLELPWSADKAIQQFGRSHRSNQASAPIYRIIVTQCGGEYRFAASAAKRLQSLGALLRGDRRALGAGQDLKSFDVDNRFGLEALKRIMDDCCGVSSPLVEVPKLLPEMRVDPTAEQTDEEFFDYMRQAMKPVGMLQTMPSRHSHYGVCPHPNVVKSVPTYLNRVLAMGMDDQEIIFKYFSATMDALIAAAKSTGRFEHGPINLQASGVSVARSDIIHKEPGTGATTYHTILNVNRGLSWEEAVAYRDAHVADTEAAGEPADRNVGFYVDRHVKDHGKTGHKFVILATRARRDLMVKRYRVQRPNTTLHPLWTAYQVTEDNYRRVSDKEAEKDWKFWYNYTEKHCTHGNNCAVLRRGDKCSYGMRIQKTELITGAVLPIWKVLFDVISSSAYGRTSKTDRVKPRIVRTSLTDTGEPIVGLSIHREDAIRLQNALEDKFGP